MDSTNRQYSGQYQQRQDYRHRTRSPRDRWRSRSPSRPHDDGFQGHHERERRQPRRRSWEPRRDDRQNRNSNTGIGCPTQAIGSSMCLGESSSEGNITDGNTPLTSVSPSSHDTSRARFHHPDLKAFAKDLNDAAKAAYPNGPKLGRNRYRTVHVCLIRWIDATEFQPEIDELDQVFQEYGFTTTKWLLLNKNSYRDLMRKTLDFIESGDDQENLFILYYAGHGRMNTARQAEWISHVGQDTPSLDWSGIQNLFAGIKSEVLILLDTCAAASSASSSQFGVMEVIAACGFESRAAPPGEFSFTRAMIEILRDWIGRESFSVAILHTEIFCQLKRKGDRRGREGTKLEWCSSPIYLRYTEDAHHPGIELYRKTQLQITDHQAANTNRPTTYTDARELNLEKANCKSSPFYSLSDNKYRIPRVLISVSLEEDQAPLDSDRCSRWFADIPFFATDIEVFPSYSTLMLMSVPLPVWNMFPSHPACTFVGYVTGPKVEPNQLSEKRSAEQKVESLLDNQPYQLKEEALPKLEEAHSPLLGTFIKPEPRELSPLTHVPSIWKWSDTTNVELPSLKEAEEASSIARTNELCRDWSASVEEWLSQDNDFDEIEQERLPNFFHIPSTSHKIDDVAIEESPIDVGVDDGFNITENKISDGETYYDVSQLKVPLKEADLALIVGRQWLGAPTIPHITNTACQQETSNKSIMRYNREAEALSICSRAASWGTVRRNSISSVTDETNLQDSSGGFLKRFTQKRWDREKRWDQPRTFSIFDMGLDRLAKFARKRAESKLKRKTAVDPLISAPSIHRTWSADKGPSVGNPAVLSSSLPSLKNTYNPKAWTAGKDLEPRTEARWATPPITDFDSVTGQVSTPPKSVREGDKTDDEESDSDESIDTKETAPKALAESIMPNYEGFKAHVRRLIPRMDPKYNWLVSRIAHQQQIRYESLLDLRVKHSQAIRANSCSSGNKCLALGGGALQLDRRGKSVPEESRNTIRSQQFPISDDENSSGHEGRISQETFPAGIPMPPTTYLPAEFECQLCFRTKRILKPSDWTKHVHEDVQPFTCTYDDCKESKSFKRMADWVRHENERHRHLEWWTCQIDDCRHVCYRKDNFLQHLVREHKIPEPRPKSKAASNNARNTEPAWIMLEKCHHETEQRPQDEPCKFCGKTFSTWKTLTAHLAKHMENISLPVIPLAQAVEVDAGTIISPIGQERYPYPGNYPSPASTASPFSYGDAGMSPAASSTYSTQYSVPQWGLPQSLMMRQQMAQSRQFGSHIPSHEFYQPVDTRNATRPSQYSMAPPWNSAMDFAPSVPMPGPSTLNPMFGSGRSARGPGAHSFYSSTPTMQPANTNTSHSIQNLPVATSQGHKQDTTIADVSEALGESRLH